MALSERSKQRLVGVHPDLVRVVERAAELAAIAGFELVVTEGVRSAERQAQLLKGGFSQTKRSRHLKAENGYAHAVDVAPRLPFEDKDGDGKDDDGIVGLSWNWSIFHRIAALVKQAAEEEAVLIEWGGDWATLKDGPHFQLPWAAYPPTRRLGGTAASKPERSIA